MALLERDIMIGASFGESVKTPKNLFEEYPTEKVREFRETSQPGDIFNTETNEITRNNKHEFTHLHSVDVVSNINDAAPELILDETKKSDHSTFKAEPRRRFRLVKQATVSLFTALTR